MEIVKININKIIPYSNNAKQHPQEQIEQIKNSIKEFGNCDPIAIDENNIIIEGHGRLLALTELGFNEVECIVLSGLTEDQKNAYRIAHNQLTMNTGWDLERLKEELNHISLDMVELGLSEELLNQIEEDNLQTEEDNYDVEQALEEIEEPVTKLGDIWQLGKHKLICGDSTKLKTIKTLMNGKEADLLLTDPPYNVDYQGGTGLKIKNDNMSDNQFYEFLKASFNNANENLKEGGAFYIWHADSEGFIFRKASNDVGWEIRQCLVWVKNTFVMGRQDYQWKHEPCLYGWKSGAAHYFINDRTQSTILNYDKPVKNAEHPTMKPVELIKRLILNSSNKHEIVLDIFGGSGSTLIACEQLDRTCYMVELDPKYCDVIINRWEQLTGEKAKLIEG